MASTGPATTFGEDACTVRTGSPGPGPLRNLAIGLIRQAGYGSIAGATRDGEYETSLIRAVRGRNKAS